MRPGENDSPQATQLFSGHRIWVLNNAWKDPVSLTLKPRDGPPALPTPQTANPTSVPLVQPHAPLTLRCRIFGPNPEQCLDAGPTNAYYQLQIHSHSKVSRCGVSCSVFLYDLTGAHAHFTHTHTHSLTMAHNGERFCFVWGRRMQGSRIRQKKTRSLRCHF